ncbi:MAG: hypothetical protein IJW48_01060 [Clostridia bacterium]|nr:hypothetical protein [Clostridia bacterium]
MTRGATSRRIWEMIVFSMLGALMFVSKVAMEALPNIHLLGVLTIVYTVVFRYKALIPIYIYVLMNGVFAGFNMWWLPYTYIWAILWGAAMLIPRTLPVWAKCAVYPLLCALHGFLFGVLYAPAQAFMFGLDFDGTLAWIAAGLPFDVIHGIGNFCVGLLIYPLSELLRKLSRGKI